VNAFGDALDLFLVLLDLAIDHVDRLLLLQHLLFRVLFKVRQHLLVILL